MQKRCDRNRKRSKRRAIVCPVHGCYLDSVGQKHQLFADRAGQLQERGINRRDSLLLIANQTTVSLTGEWLEAFWCDHCQETRWYRVRKRDSQTTSQAATYDLSVAPPELWQQAMGMIDPHGNPSVSEFTRRQSRMPTHTHLKDFRFIG